MNCKQCKKLETEIDLAKYDNRHLTLMLHNATSGTELARMNEELKSLRRSLEIYEKLRLQERCEYYEHEISALSKAIQLLDREHAKFGSREEWLKILEEHMSQMVDLSFENKNLMDKLAEVRGKLESK